MKLNSNLDAQGTARIQHLPTPVSADEPGTKGYIDALIAGRTFHDTVRAASAANVNVASAPAAIDGVALSSGNADRVLLKDQTAGAENGIYVFNGAGSAMTRAADGVAGGLKTGSVVPVSEGTANSDTDWQLITNDPLTIGTTALAFTQLGAPTGAGTGLSKSGNTISLSVPVAVGSGGTGATTTGGAKTNLGFITKFAQDFGDAASTSFNITHNLGTTDVIVQIYNKGTGAQEEADITTLDANRVQVSGFASAPANNAYRIVVFG